MSCWFSVGWQSGGHREQRGEAPAGPWSAPRCHALLASDCPVDLSPRGRVRRPGRGRPSKMCWLLGPLENPFLASSRQPCPALGHPGVVVTAKRSAMETPVQPRAAWRAGQLLSAGTVQFPSALLPFPLVSCCAWPGLALDSEALLLQGDPRARSPFSRQEAAQLALTPRFRLPPSSPLFLPKVRPCGPSWRPGTPGSEHLSWPGASLCKQRSVCIPGLVRALPASGASLPLWFQACLGAENRNQPCVFQAARLLRSSCLSPEIPCFRSPPAPFREEGTCSPQAGFLSLPMKGKFLGRSLAPFAVALSLWSRDPLPPQSRSCLMSEHRSWGPCRGLLPPDCGQDHPGKSFLNSNSRSQPWGNCCPEGAGRRLGFPLWGWCWGPAGRKAIH